MKKIWSEKISLNYLSLWDENARFPEEYFNKSEKYLIDYFLKKKDFKIELFAKEIVNEFDLPQLEKIVIYRYKGKNIILEGNRRVVIYKLLIEPSLTNDPNIQLFFRELAGKIKIDKNFYLEALVTNDRESGLRYVDRKHTKRNNEVGWGEQERHNYKIRRGNASAKTEVFRYELGKLVKMLDLPDEIKESILGKGFISTFYRLVDSDPAIKLLGIQKNDDGTIKIKNQKEFSEKLKIIIFDIITKRVIGGNKLDSRFLNKTEEKEKYLKSIGSSDKKRVEKEIKDNTSTDIFGKKVVNIKIAKADSIYGSQLRQFHSLIDPSFLFPDVQSDKIKEVFSELQRINLELCPTAVALLVRTLMEISVGEFAFKVGIKIDKNGYFRTDTGKTKESLKEKIDYISALYAPYDIKDIVTVFNGNSIFTENLNQIAHSRHIFSSKDKVKTLWKDSKCFWEFLISKIIEIEKKKK
jgi:hypothetical protein